MNMLFVSALLLVRNESKEFTIASTRMSTEIGDRTDRDSILPDFCFLFIIIYLQILGKCIGMGGRAD